MKWSGLDSTQDILLCQQNIHEFAQYFADLSDLGRVHSFFELFQESPPLLSSELPDHEFWHCTPSGLRRPTPGKSTFRVPKGRALILEIAARGWFLGCTHLSYLEDVLHLINRYLPGLPIHLLRISFDWKPTVIKPMLTILKAHNEKRKLRDKSLCDSSSSAFRAIEHYWRQRPSSISFHHLGGELNPCFELLEM